MDLIVQLLNRNPRKRLGAGPSDSEEIKNHPFFKSINWDHASKRKLKPPKPHIRPIYEQKISLSSFQDKNDNNDDDKLKSWTFVSNDFN